jgi:hypothetical protein
MLENIKDERLRKQLKFFFRFLKENGIYSAYKRNIFNPKTYNQFQKHDKNWSLEKCARKHGVDTLITMLISWCNTKEGYDYWMRKHVKFVTKFRKKFNYDL